MKTLTTEETKQHFLSGDRIRKTHWGKGVYIYLDIMMGCIRNNSGDSEDGVYKLDDGKWELYTEPTNNIIEPMRGSAGDSDEVLLTKLHNKQCEIIDHINKQGQ